MLGYSCRVLHGFLHFWGHYFSNFSIGCNNGKMMTMTETMVQLQLGGKPSILLQSTCTTTYQFTTCVKQSIWLHKQATCSGKNFEEIIFVVQIKSTKTAKFIVLENFPLYVLQYIAMFVVLISLHHKNDWTAGLYTWVFMLYKVIQSVRIFFSLLPKPIFPYEMSFYQIPACGNILQYTQTQYIHNVTLIHIDSSLIHMNITKILYPKHSMGLDTPKVH